MPKERKQVGTVKAVVRAADGGNEVKRIPVYEGDDPEVVLAEAQANNGRQVEKPAKSSTTTPPELESVRPEPKRRR